MAGDWIKMRGNLWDDPRVARICDMTDSSEGPVIGALYWLWATADQHTEDGAMPGLTLRQIDRKTGLPGFAAALVEIGWLADDPQGVVILHFEEHNGESAKKRCQTARRVAAFKARNSEETPVEPEGNATTVSTALPREEKRREEEPNTGKTARKRATPSCPDGVDESVWTDWIALRKAKRAPVTGTVVAEAESEALKAGMTFEAFLRVWCARGSQGLQADWLKPHERNCGPPQTFKERDAEIASARMAEFAPGVAARPKQTAEVIDVTARRLG